VFYLISFDIVFNLVQLVQQNNQDLVDLRQKIERQRDFFQKQLHVFQKRLDVFNGPRNGEFKFDDSEMIVLFRKYIVFVPFCSPYAWLR
jgi:hypothetical protein